MSLHNRLEKINKSIVSMTEPAKVYLVAFKIVDGEVINFTISKDEEESVVSGDELEDLIKDKANHLVFDTLTTEQLETLSNEL